VCTSALMSFSGRNGARRAATTLSRVARTAPPPALPFSALALANLTTRFDALIGHAPAPATMVPPDRRIAACLTIGDAPTRAL